MENYNEQVNYGTETKPLRKDRLMLTNVRNDYGYRLFDRKLKVNLVYGHSSENCMTAKKILLSEGKGDKFKEFMESIKDEEITTNNVLVEYGKHGDRHFSVPTLKHFHKAALFLLRDRVDVGYIQKWDIPEPLDYTMEDAEKLPESFKFDAKKKLKEHNDRIKTYKSNNSDYNEAENALNNNNGYAAWRILSYRYDNEYERVEIIKPMTFD